MKRFSPTLIGVFVIGALVLGAIGILAVGGQAWWRERERIVLYFDGSIYGLERGSAVRLMGVRVGQVVEIHVGYGDGGGTTVQVVCEIDSSPTVGGNLRDRETLEKMVDDGLQARLDLIGITGLLFVEMGFFGVPPERVMVRDHPQYVVVPTVESVLTGVTDNLAEIAMQLGEVDFAGLGESARQLLDTANTTLEQARVEELFERLHRTARAVEALVESPELQETIEAAGESFEDVSRLAEQLEGRVDPLTEDFAVTSEEFRQTLEVARETLVAVEDLAGPRMGLGFQFGETLTTIEEAARAVARLAEFLERNPQAIIRGTADQQ